MPDRNHGLQAAALLLALLVGAAAAAPHEHVARADQPATFASTARSVGRHGRLRVPRLRLDGDGHDSELELERFDVWAPGARVEVHGAAGGLPQLIQPPDTHYFRGRIAGDASSTVVLAVDANGGMQGVVHRGRDGWSLSKHSSAQGSGAAAPLVSTAAPAAAPSAKPFECGVEKEEWQGTQEQLSVPGGAGNRKLLQARMPLWRAALLVLL